jgi:hypothetical protein
VQFIVPKWQDKIVNQQWIIIDKHFFIVPILVLHHFSPSLNQSICCIFCSIVHHLIFRLFYIILHSCIIFRKYRLLLLDIALFLMFLFL